jgi:ribosomal protein L16/L10AE
MALKLNQKGFGINYSLVIQSKKKHLFPNRFGVHGSGYRFTKFHKLVARGSSSVKVESNIVSANSEYSSGTLIRVVSRAPIFRYLTERNVKSCRNLIRKPYKRFIQPYFYPYLGITKKPAEVRMGKGKGSKIAHRVFPVQAGFRLFSSTRRSNTRTSDLRFIAKMRGYTAKFPVVCSSQIGSLLCLILCFFLNEKFLTKFNIVGLFLNK